MRRAAALLIAVCAACNDTGTYTFAAREFDDQRGCLSRVTALDVLSGSDPGLRCAPRCFVSNAKTEAAIAPVYASTECGPAPPGFDTTDSDPRCQRAKDAVSRGNFCLADGGQTSPLDASDGAAADASDAGLDQ